MSDLTLFHYPMSPFSEKVRVMLGYAGLPWQSVTVREMPPRPALELLAGGYRKIPVAQIGADVFCDSRAIATEIARLANRPELVLEQQSAEVQDFVSEVDLEIFLACVMAASDGRLLRQLIRDTSLWHALRFLKDRISMGRKSRVPAMKGPQAKARVLAHMADMEERLSRPFLFGDTPCIGDFSAYHGLWFVCDLAGKPWLRDYPKVAAWLERVKAFGHGSPVPATTEAAIANARASEPRALPESAPHELLGKPASIAPADYGRDPVRGTLVYASDHEWVLARDTPKTGTVHVHFPALGFSLQPG